VLNGILLTRQDGFPQKSFEFPLNLVRGLKFKTFFVIRRQVPGATQQDSLAQIAEIVKSFLVMKGTPERKIIQGGGNQHLASGWFDIQLRDQCPGVCVGADQDPIGAQADVMRRVQFDLTVGYLVAGDFRTGKEMDTLGLQVCLQSLHEFAGMKLALQLVLDQVLYPGESEFRNFAVLEPEDFFGPDDFFQRLVHPVDLAPQDVDVILFCLGQ